MTEFFWSCDENEKCLRQIAYIIYNSFLYSHVRRYINAIIVERLFFKSSRHSGRYETSTANWLVLDNDTSRIPEITHAQLFTSDVHYKSLGELIEDLPSLKDFETLVVEDPSSAKVVKISASSSPTNRSNGRSSEFVKYSNCLGSVKRSPLLIKIEGPFQLLTAGVICLLFSDVGSVGNGNDEQLQFNYILWFDSGFG